MFLLLSHDKTLSEVQHFFTSKYPYLKIEFYKKQDREQLSRVKRTHLSPSMTLKASGLEKNEVIDISKDMTVADLENIFSQSGLNVQVSRKSGIVWLETTMTDQWSLEKQNEHGREISVPAGESKPGDKT